ncbi:MULTISPECIES: radical SAM peptide maturase [Bacteroides]|uniref:radical SAM peptide maturase n=1 Tax=Bacteroides TaxID=816 RepID=UPI001F22521E|nr:MULTISPECIES: radical SAM peptide maturase [Bacteroides]MCE9108380.1 radical SAM peptide maturase [Bacteroides pyogenes]MCI6213622.1 radical SAM peptide maturase [Bacteroides heparinolyticus]
MKEYLSPGDVKRCLANTPQVTFEVTDACNLRCEYCGYGKFYSDYDERKNQMLPTEKATRFLDFLIDLWNSSLNTSINQNVYISFYGGEPLINFPFIQKIVHHLQKADCKTRRFTFSMTTNAILLNRYMDYLAEHKFNLLISLDGNEYNTSYRVDSNGKNSFDRITRNVDLLKEKYPEYFKEHVNFNAVLHNRNSVGSIYAFFKERYGKIPSIGELNSTGIRKDMIEEFEKTYKSSTESLLQSEHYSEIEKDMFLKSPTYHSATVFLMQHSEFRYNNYNELLYGKPKEEFILPTGTCLPFAKKVFITVNGKILPCERIGHQFALGKIDDDMIDLDFEAIAQKYNAYYAKMDRVCDKCHNKKACIQCMFNLADIDENKKPKCLGFMDKKSFDMYKNAQYSFLARNPGAYYRIMNDVIIE